VTIVVLKSKSTLIFICDECREAVHLHGEEGQETLPVSWKKFEVKGWVGEFHACSAECEHMVLARFTKGGPEA
jgi:hypothetical protein